MDTTIGEEYSKSSPLGFTLVKDVSIPINWFKRSPPKIVYWLFQKNMKMKSRHELLFTTNFTQKSPFSLFWRTQKGQIACFHLILGNGRTFKTYNFLSSVGSTQLLLQRLVLFDFHYKILNFSLYIRLLTMMFCYLGTSWGPQHYKRHFLRS
jgi:hypothetical protein